MVPTATANMWVEFMIFSQICSLSIYWSPPAQGICRRVAVKRCWRFFSICTQIPHATTAIWIWIPPKAVSLGQAWAAQSENALLRQQGKAGCWQHPGCCKGRRVRATGVSRAVWRSCEMCALLRKNKDLEFRGHKGGSEPALLTWVWAQASSLYRGS